MSERDNILESLAQQISDAVARVIPTDGELPRITPEDLRLNITTIIESILGKFQLVPMSEFEGHAKLLEQLGEQLIRLEIRLEELERPKQAP